MPRSALKIPGIDKLDSGTIPAWYTADFHTLPDTIARLLFQCRKLSDSAFDDMVHQDGWRLATLIVKAKMAQGDTKALEMYLKLAGAWREGQSRVKKPPSAGVKASASFIQESREVSTPPPLDKPDANTAQCYTTEHEDNTAPLVKD